MNNKKSIKMRNMPMGKLIFSMSLPAIFSMFVQALYNIVDTKYVSMYDTTTNDGVTALGYAFIVQMIVMAFALGIGIGANILISRKLGQGKPEEASNIGKCAIIIATIMGFVMFALSWFVPKWFMNFISNSESIQMAGIDYLQIVMMLSIFMMIEFSLSKMLQGMGQMIIPMITQLVGAIINIALDPVFIFTLDMGIQGAAIATIIGQFIAMCIEVIYVSIKRLDISFNLINYRFRFSDVKEIFIAGIPVTVMNSIAAFVNFILYALLNGIDPSETASTVLSIYYKLQSFIFMPVFGLTQGGLPILSYNYGANIQSRFKKGLIILYITSLSVMLIGFSIFQIVPNVLLSFLSVTDEAMSVGKIALRIVSWSFIPAAFGIISGTSFQAIGHSNKALIMSILRQGVFLVPLAYLFSRFMGVKGVWLAFPIAELLCIIIFIPILIVITKKAFVLLNKNKLEEEALC